MITPLLFCKTFQFRQRSREIRYIIMVMCLMVLSGCAVKHTVSSQLRLSGVTLPFLPVAINNSEVIVGNDRTLGAMRYHDGTSTELSHLPDDQPYEAIDITTSGVTLGFNGTDNNMVMWVSPTLPINSLEESFGAWVPDAMNNSRVVIGWAGDALTAWKWSLAKGYTELKVHPLLEEWSPGRYFARPIDINDAGYIVGIATTLAPSNLISYIMRWSPNGTATLLDTVGFRGSLHIRNSGEVIWVHHAQDTKIKRWLAGTYSDEEAPAGIERLTVVSNTGRLAGTLKVNGVLQGWTSFKGTMQFLDPTNPQPGDYVEPTGINDCGSIVGVVHRSNSTFEGIYFRRSFIPLCDTPPVFHQ